MTFFYLRLIGSMFLVSFFLAFFQLLPTDAHKGILVLLGFDRGLDSISFDPKVNLVKDRKTVNLIETAKDCGNCHTQVYENWLTSRHKVAHTNKLYQYSFKLEPLPWCENCHAPLRFPISTKLYKPEEGISCNVCHVRNGKIIVGEIPKTNDNLLHDYTENAEFATAKLCESCHQFNFPSWRSLNGATNPIEFAHLSMQGTGEEWRSSGLYLESDCIDCHLAPNSKKSHLFSGGHSLPELKKSFVVESKYIGSKTISISIKATRIGHSFPTGDLFRTLRLKVFSLDGKLLNEFLMRKNYRTTTEFERSLSPEPKILLSDTRIPPPSLLKDNAEIDFLVEVTNRPSKLRFELWIEYLNDAEKLLSPFGVRESKKEIINEIDTIKNRSDFDGDESG